MSAAAFMRHLFIVLPGAITLTKRMRSASIAGCSCLQAPYQTSLMVRFTDLIFQVHFFKLQNICWIYYHSGHPFLAPIKDSTSLNNNKHADLKKSACLAIFNKFIKR